MDNTVKFDDVNKPKHYNFSSLEPIDVIEDWGLPFQISNALKYVTRAGKKDKDSVIKDIEKALWYTNRYELYLSNKPVRLVYYKLYNLIKTFLYKHNMESLFNKYNLEYVLNEWSDYLTDECLYVVKLIYFKDYDNLYRAIEEYKYRMVSSDDK